jgi:beta-lactamase regulating signal transducer with metallopeptidase domain
MNLTDLDVLTPALHALVHATWQAGLLAVIVFVATRCAGDRLRANWRFALWLVVFARLAIPWIPSTSWSLYSFLPNVEPQTDSKNPPTAAQGNGLRKMARQADRARDLDMTCGANSSVAAPSTATVDVAAANDTVPTNESPARVSGVVLWRLATLIWLAGLLVLVIRMVWMNVRLARWRASWPAAADPALGTLLQQCRDEARVCPTVVLQLAPRDIGPAACGVLSPAIVLPNRLTASLARDELRLVLLHELIHVRRHDALVDLAAWGIACVHWFNPAAWLALAGLRRERELACDAALLDLLGTGARRDYGSVLLKAVETLQSTTATAGAVAMFERRFFSDPLERRIQMIANYRPTTGAARLLSGILLIALAMCGLTDAGGLPSRDGEKPAVATQQVAPASTAAADKLTPDELLPVPAERAAAEKIRELGGWYELGSDRHVIEVNMVYHEDLSSERQENPQKTDRALAHIANFPRLKWLGITETQASDDGLKFVGRLPELEELFIWDGETITDKGVAHLRSLRKLKFIHLNGSSITDEAVAHLSQVSSLETLSLDGNALTDKSLEYASRLPRLRDLTVGNYGPESKQIIITAEGLEHVRQMPMLEQLCIPYMPTGGQDLKPLHGLKRLEFLVIEDILFQGKINEEAIFELQKTSPHLKVLADRKFYPSLKQIVDAADPEQQKINRQEALEGLKIIERFLDLMGAGRDSEAVQFGDRSEIVSIRRYSKGEGPKPLKVSVAYGDREAVMALTEPPVTYKQYELIDEERRVIGEKTANFVVKAEKKNGTWRVKDTYPEDEGSDDAIKRFLLKYPGAQELVPPAKP